ncbi:MAG: hypothetical protein V8T86_03185 [Victivallis sp.]
MELPVSLLVRSFELPRRNSIPVVFSFFPDFYKEWYDRKTLTAAEREAINRFLADYRIPPNNIYANGLFPDWRPSPNSISALPPPVISSTKNR